MASTAEIEAPIRMRWECLRHSLNEAQQRRWAAAEAKAQGYGGVTVVARVTGLSRSLIHRGLEEFDDPKDVGRAASLASGHVRRPGGGRKKLTEHDPTLESDLERLVEPVTRGDPMSPLRWTCKSLETLAKELHAQGHQICKTMVGVLLKKLDYTLQGNAKTDEGASHADRNAQFEHINREVSAALAAGQPAISVDAKKRELIGPHKNAGREWRPQGEPEQVNVYDFVAPDAERATPYGVYDLRENAAWVNVGIGANTAQFAVESIRRWWEHMGKALYGGAKRLVITADSGGGNGYRCRLWKAELQKLADELGMEISVCHFPPGTSKWNKIEHRLFSFITMNWRGRPLQSYEIVVNLIGATRNEKGLHVEAELDTNIYETGIKVTTEEFAAIDLRRDEFHGEWNYNIAPREVAYAAAV